MTLTRKLVIGLSVLGGAVILTNLNLQVDGVNLPGEYISATDVIILRQNGTYSQSINLDDPGQGKKNGEGVWRLYSSSDERPTIACGEGDKIFMSNYINYDYSENRFRESEVCLSLEEHLLRTDLIFGDIIYSKKH